jgi:2-hydroxychromene-2-carboxylate isomerase
VRGPIFLYDLGSPECYLAAERVSAVLGIAPEWEPVLGRWRDQPGAQSVGAAMRLDLGPKPDNRAVESLALERDLQPIRWPVRWPPDSRLAMLAATYAKSIGRATAFSLAAFRQAFAAGRDLGDGDTVVIAAAACEMHPAAVLKALHLRSVSEALQRATAQAVAMGVRRLPAVIVGELVFEGDGGLDEAAAALVTST